MTILLLLTVIRALSGCTIRKNQEPFDLKKKKEKDHVLI